MLGPLFLPFIGGPPPVTTLDDGGETRSKRREEYVYKKPILHHVYFKSKAFEFSYSFASFKLKEYERDYRVRFSSKTRCFSDSCATVYSKNAISSHIISDSTVSIGGFYYRTDFSGGQEEGTFKDSTKASFLVGTYDNKYEMEDAAILFHLCINL
jgi:hypothetical protein